MTEQQNDTEMTQAPDHGPVTPPAPSYSPLTPVHGTAEEHAATISDTIQNLGPIVNDIKTLVSRESEAPLPWEKPFLAVAPKLQLVAAGQLPAYGVVSPHLDYTRGFLEEEYAALPDVAKVEYMKKQHAIREEMYQAQLAEINGEFLEPTYLPNSSLPWQ